MNQSLRPTEVSLAYLRAFAGHDMATAATGVDTIAVFGDDDRAMVMYDMRTGPFGVLRAADYFEVRNGKITADKLVFDTYEVRRGQGEG